MSFEPTLEKMIADCPGVLGIALMGGDGIPVAQAFAPAADDDVVGSAGVEFGRILDEVRKASDAIGGGRLEEAVIGLARFTLIFRGVDDELFLVAALTPDANLGRARFGIRRHLLELREHL